MALSEGSSHPILTLLRGRAGSHNFFAMKKTDVNGTLCLQSTHLAIMLTARHNGVLLQAGVIEAKKDNVCMSVSVLKLPLPTRSRRQTKNFLNCFFFCIMGNKFSAIYYAVWCSKVKYALS